MKFFKINFYIIFFALSFSSELSSNITLKENLQYRVTMQNIYAGESNIAIHYTSLGNEPVYKIISETRSNRFVDFIYKIRDKVIMIVNPENYSLLHVTKKINQGDYIKRYSSIIDYKESKIFYKGDEIPIEGNVYDPLGIILNLRLQKLTLNNSFSFVSYNKKKLQNVIITVKGKETIQVPNGEYICWILEPEFEYLDDEDETMKIWISDDAESIPIKIEKYGKYGTMVLSLSEYSIYE